VLAGGLLMGVFMGQQTWRSVRPSSAQPSRQRDAIAAHELDYLTDAPGVSLAESYLMLTGDSRPNGA
jgi:hypothetical protein